VKLRVGVNSGNGDREGRVVIANESGKTLVIARIIQHSMNSFILEREFTPVSSESSTFSFPVSTQIPYIATVKNKDSWVSVSKDSKGIYTCTVAENLSSGSRSETVYFYDEHEIELGSHIIFQHGNKPSVVKFNHSNQTMILPDVDGSSFDKAVVENEGRYQMYVPQSKVVSNGSDEHETVITANRAESISFLTLKGVTSIDLSNF